MKDSLWVLVTGVIQTHRDKFDIQRNGKDKNILTMSLPTFYVKMDNMIPTRGETPVYHAIYAISGPELLQKVKEIFRWKDTPRTSLQLWSAHSHGSLRRLRLDTLPVLPLEHEFVLARIYSSS